MSIDPDRYIASLRQCKFLPERDIKRLCEIVRAMLMEESNIQPVSSPVTVCGDIHGQLWDMLELLRVGGECPDTSYIFMVSRLHPVIHWTLCLPLRLSRWALPLHTGSVDQYTETLSH